MLTDLDKAIIRELQGDLPLVPHPYAQVAKKLNIDEEELLDRIRWMQDRGMIRRLGAAIRHREAGFTANAMIVWRVAEEKAEEVGRKLAACPEVTHCYLRPEIPGWPYNLYTMVHGQSRQECEALAAQLSEKVGIEDYRILYSTRELKKSSMRYYLHETESS